jgi:acyl-CoA synthetase (AMP-forming)/AMP-acid ligase II
MIRNLMLGMSLFALTGASAIAAPAATHHAKAKVVAQAPAADAPATTTDKPAKKAKKEKAPKKDKGDATKMENKGSAPAGEKAPAPEAPKGK